ncbi:uncharacterized protein LOC110704155 [Chenopodium quinoa]|uniref:uncharacterized protein LOC110704155 n=1 Tax=Chenopodium quinoa TaxID=63459 RepID=UPI000B78CC04|nr:uncharacterized protein LOC110704155 [Chenopodium quinoa]
MAELPKKDVMDKVGRPHDDMHNDGDQPARVEFTKKKNVEATVAEKGVVSEGVAPSRKRGRPRKEGPKHYPIVRTYPKDVVKVLKKISSQRRKYVRKTVFKSFLDIKIKHFDRNFLAYLYSRWDASRKVLRIRDDYEVQIDDEMVGWITGLPYGEVTRDIPPVKRGKSSIQDMKTENRNAGGIGYRVVHNMCLDEAKEKSEFLKHFVLYVFGNILCTTTSNNISPDLCWLVRRKFLRDAKKYSWSKFILEWMVKYGNGDSTKGFKGSPTVLMADARSTWCISFKKKRKKHCIKI